MTLLSVLVLGLFLGMRHATDADHVVAVTTIVSRERSPRAAMLVGALWGAGHTLTIMLVGGAIVLFGLVIPPHLGLSMEFSVAIMLIVLGVMNASGVMQRIDELAHGASAAHGADTGEHGSHASPSPAAATDAHAAALAPRAPRRRLRSFVVGVVHGLAGSAAVALLVLTTIREVGWALLYLGVFGAGTLLGMMLLTTAMAVPVLAAGRRFAFFEKGVPRVAGWVSIAFGLFLAYKIGFVDGLFTADPSWDPH
jgi:high-affinity nickel-transport protein